MKLIRVEVRVAYFYFRPEQSDEWRKAPRGTKSKGTCDSNFQLLMYALRLRSTKKHGLTPLSAETSPKQPQEARARRHEYPAQQLALSRLRAPRDRGRCDTRRLYMK